MDRYEQARELYAEYGIDTEKALKVLAGIPISLHCWQADDIKGFSADSSLSGGIQVTGNYPGAARTPEELLCDYGQGYYYSRPIPAHEFEARYFQHSTVAGMEMR